MVIGTTGLSPAQKARIGEAAEDMQPFVARDYARALLSGGRHSDSA